MKSLHSPHRLPILLPLTQPASLWAPGRPPEGHWTRPAGSKTTASMVIVSWQWAGMWWCEIVGWINSVTLPPVLYLIIPLTDHPRCPRNASFSIFTFPLKTEVKKGKELEKQRGQVVSRKVPLGGARQGGSRGPQGQGPSDLKGGGPHSCADRSSTDPPGPDLEGALNAISPNLGFKSTDVQRGSMNCPCL